MVAAPVFTIIFVTVRMLRIMIRDDANIQWMGVVIAFVILRDPSPPHMRENTFGTSEEGYVKTYLYLNIGRDEGIWTPSTGMGCSKVESEVRSVLFHTEVNYSFFNRSSLLLILFF